MKTKQLKIFTNKNGRLTWAINVESDGKFAFVNFNKERFTATKQQLMKGYWEGNIPKKVREYAIQNG